jgi:hypothetical protein
MIDDPHSNDAQRRRNHILYLVSGRDGKCEVVRAFGGFHGQLKIRTISNLSLQASHSYHPNTPATPTHSLLDLVMEAGGKRVVWGWLTDPWVLYASGPPLPLERQQR